MSNTEVSESGKPLERQISVLALNGLSKEEIARKLSMYPDRVDDHIVANGINVWRGKRIEESELSIYDQQAIPVIESLAKQGKTVAQIADELGIEPNRVSKLAILKKIEVKRQRTVRSKPHIDELASKGASSGDLAEADGTTAENVIRYLIRSGKHDEWKAKRGESLQRTLVYQEIDKQFRDSIALLYPQLRNNIGYLAAQQGWAASKAAEYYLSPRTRGVYSLENLVILFLKYQQAQAKGERVSLASLGAHMEIFSSSVGYILNAVGLKPLYGSRDKKMLFEWQKEAISLAHNTSFSGSDAAHFIKVPCHVVTQRWRRQGCKSPPKLLYQSNKGALTRALASQIYEAAELGFSASEIMELLDTDLQLVAYAESHREKIELGLINSLRTIFPQRNIDKPYL